MTIHRLISPIVRLLLTAVVLCPLPAHALSVQEDNLSVLSLEELMAIRVEPVFGASKRVQPVTEAPSSVSIVTAADIVRYGYRTLADILRSVRGLYVTDDRNYAYIGARGFARPGDYNSRVLILIDGHRINDNVFDTAPIGLELGVDLSTFERVEIIRGPASALYGTSAFFAVVNITTKPGSAVNGVVAGVEAGSLGARRVHALAGKTAANGVDVMVSASATRLDGADELYFPEFDAPETNDGIAEALDGESARTVSAKVSGRGFSVSAMYGWREKEVPTASFGTMFNAPGLVVVDARSFLDASYERALGGAHLAVRGHVDHFNYHGDYPYAPAVEGDPPDVESDYGRGGWWGGEARVTADLPGRQALIAGVEYRDNMSQDQGITNGVFAVDFATHASSRVFAAYVQDEVRVHDKWLLSLGGRYDAYTGFNRFSPRASVVFTPAPSRSFKYLFGTAFRAPNAYEFDYLTDGVRNEDLGAEKIITHEVVWEEYVRTWLRTAVSSYVNTADDLTTLITDDEEMLSYVNAGRVRARGVSGEVEIKLPNGIQTLAAYSFQKAVDRDTDERLTNAPCHLAKIRFSARGVAAASTVAMELQAMSSRLTVSGAEVGAHAVVNLNYVHPIGSQLRLQGSVRNLFDTEYGDPASEEHLQDAIPQDGITARVGLEFGWGAKR